MGLDCARARMIGAVEIAAALPSRPRRVRRIERYSLGTRIQNMKPEADARAASAPDPGDTKLLGTWAVKIRIIHEPEAPRAGPQPATRPGCSGECNRLPLPRQTVTDCKNREQTVTLVAVPFRERRSTGHDHEAVRRRCGYPAALFARTGWQGRHAGAVPSAARGDSLASERVLLRRLQWRIGGHIQRISGHLRLGRSHRHSPSACGFQLRESLRFGVEADETVFAGAGVVRSDYYNLIFRPQGIHIPLQSAAVRDRSGQALGAMLIYRGQRDPN